MTADHETDSTEIPAAPTVSEREADSQSTEPATTELEMVDKPATPKRKRAAKPVRRKKRPTVDQVIARFAACARCSFFLTGYRAQQEAEALAAAVANAKTGWLALNWGPQMRELVHKSYGVRMDIAYAHYEASCRECRRRFVFHAADEDGLEHTFLIEL